MKKSIVKFIGLGILCSLLIYSCKNKDEETADVSNDEMNVGTTQASDVDNSTSSLDDAINIVNDNIASHGTSGARLDATNDCNVTVDYSHYSTVSGSNQKTIVFSFSTSNTCNGRTKGGTITVTLVKGNLFRDMGAVYTINFDGYGVNATGKTVTLTGTQTVTNVTGGLPKDVISNSSVTVEHKVRGEMELTFDNSTGKRSWQLSRDITWANANNVISYTVKGDTSVDGYDNLSAWGTNRFDNKFYTQITKPITANSTCGWFRPTGGERKHTLISAADGSTLYTVTASINTDSQGCGDGYTVTTVTKRGKSRTKTITY